MLFRIIIFISLLFLVISMANAIDVSGEVSGTWTLANSPYNVVGNLTVLEGDELSIQPGVNVVFQGNYLFTAQGTIMAIGTESDSIRFTGPPSMTTWDSIRLENEIFPSSFKYCVIQNAETGISSIRSPFDISFSRITLSSRAINLFGIDSTAEIQITRNYIHNILGTGIHITEGGSHIYISQNRITQCGLNPQYVGAIHLQNQSADGLCNPNIWRNHIYNNAKQGIAAWDITNNSRINPTIEDNIIEYNLTGVYLIHASGEIHNNIVRYNFITGDTNSGAGFMLSGDSCSPRMTHNTITGNYTGFYITQNATPILFRGSNKIFSNIDPTNTDWSIYLLNSTANIDATRNRFTTTDPNLIAASIFDSNDYPSLGTVNFSSFLQNEIVHGTIVNHPDFNPNDDTFIFLDFHTIQEDGSIFTPIDYSYNIFINEFYIMENPGLYFLTADLWYSGESDDYLGVYGSFEEPSILKLEQNSLLIEIEINMARVLRNWNIIRYEESFVHNDKLIIPMSDYHHYYLFRTKKLYLYDEGDFIYYHGERKINVETGQWEDYFITEPQTYLKVRNISLYDEWSSPLAERNIVRHIGDEVQIDMVNEVEGIEMVTARLFFTQNIGLTQRKTYSPLYFNLLEDMSLAFEPFYTDPSSIMPLEENFMLHYESEVLSIINHDKPTSFSIFEDGFFQWDPPFPICPIEYGPSFRIYKNNQIYAVIDHRQFYYQIDPSELIGSWYVTYYIEAIGESEPSNVVTFTSETDHPLPKPTLSIIAYPNPLYVSSSKSLSFDIKIPSSEKVKLDIYNIKGQKIATLYENTPEKNDFTINFGNQQLKELNLSSGIYFYRLKAGDEIITKKTLFLK